MSKPITQANWIQNSDLQNLQSSHFLCVFLFLWLLTSRSLNALSVIVPALVILVSFLRTKRKLYLEEYNEYHKCNTKWPSHHSYL